MRQSKVEKILQNILSYDFFKLSPGNGLGQVLVFCVLKQECCRWDSSQLPTPPPPRLRKDCHMANGQQPWPAGDGFSKGPPALHIT